MEESELDELNRYIKQGCPYIKIVEDGDDGGVVTYAIELEENKYIRTKHHSLNMEDILREDIGNFLKGKGIQVNGWNMNGTRFWIRV